MPYQRPHHYYILPPENGTRRSSILSATLRSSNEIGRSPVLPLRPRAVPLRWGGLGWGWGGTTLSWRQYVKIDCLLTRNTRFPISTKVPRPRSLFLGPEKRETGQQHLFSYIALKAMLCRLGLEVGWVFYPIRLAPFAASLISTALQDRSAPDA